MFMGAEQLSHIGVLFSAFWKKRKNSIKISIVDAPIYAPIKSG